MEEYHYDELWAYGVDDVDEVFPNIYLSAYHTADNIEKLNELGKSYQFLLTMNV